MRSLQITNSITDRESHIVESYFSEISKTVLISPEEEADLARKIKMGDEAALEKLVKANLRFVVSVAKKYQKQGLPLSDLIGEGNAGLIKAARRFDETKGFRFISFAVWWIRQSIMLAIAEQTRVVHLPMNQINLLTKIKSCSGNLEQQLERVPENDELASYMDMPESKIKVAKICGTRTVSLDTQTGPHEDYTLIDRLWNKEHLADNRLETEAFNGLLALLLSHLTQRERSVIEFIFGLNGCTQASPEDIAENFEITTERVRQLKRKGISKMAAIVAGNSNLFSN